ncbi:Chloroplast J-like domain 1 [Raphanus sativus]|nr:Chloroplast J-like domain 1 [Raphanus sativus]
MGVTFGSFKVSKDIRYADKQPIIPWGPRYSKSSRNDMLINLAISAVFSAWIVIKPPSSPTYNEEGEENGRGLRMGKRLLRSLSLVFGSILVASLVYTGILNFIEYMGSSIPITLYNNQELIVTASSALMLYVMASYYR